MSDIFENGFSTTEDGVILYSPFGYFGKRYIIPDQEQKQKIFEWYKRWLVTFFMFSVSIQIGCMIVFDSLYLESDLKSDLQLGVFLLFIFLYSYRSYHVKNKRLSGFEYTKTKYPLSKIVKESAGSRTYIQLLFAEIGLLVFMAISAHASFLFPKDPSIGNRPPLFLQICMICVFVVSLIAIVWVLCLMLIKIHSHFAKKIDGDISEF